MIKNFEDGRHEGIVWFIKTLILLDKYPHFKYFSKFLDQNSYKQIVDIAENELHITRLAVERDHYKN